MSGELRFFGLNVPNTKWWKIKQSITYLNEHPLPTDDVLYFSIILRQILSTMKEESVKTTLTIKKCDRYKLRWIECLCDNSIRDLLEHRTDALSRGELDGMNVPNALSALHDKLASLYNDDNHIPSTRC